MEQDREHVVDDLRGLLAGEVLSNALALQMYASDASIYEIEPLVVVRPRHTQDVADVVRYASENQIPIHARGAGSGLSGQALGTGIVVDFSRFMRRIIRTDDETIRVQPGVVHRQLNDHLAPLGRQFGPDPATSNVTTMGGVVGTNSTGSHLLACGAARDMVESMQVVLADGSITEFSRHSVSTRPAGDEEPRAEQMVRDLSDLLARNANLIAQHQPKTRVNSCGYQIFDVLAQGQLDIARLLTGSEGTLALITELTLRTSPLPKHRGVALLMFESMDKATAAVQEVLPFGPSACDLMDRRHLSLAREGHVHYDLLIPAAAEALLLVEIQSESAQQVRDTLATITDRIRNQRDLAFHTHRATEPDEVELYWQLAQRVVPTLHRLQGTNRPLPFVEDIAVAPEDLPEFVVALQNVLKKHQVTASVFGHAGHGQLHIRPLLDLSSAEDLEKLEPLATDLYEQVFALRGTISGEHGDGLSRSGFVAAQYGPLWRVMADVKRIFDPQNILNPGKVIQTGGNPLTKNLRHVASVVREQPGLDEAVLDTPQDKLPARVDLQLVWDAESMTQEARTCNGCGLCRVHIEGVRMCPIHHVANTEEASPRAKANLVRGVLTGQLTPEQMATDDFKRVADLCVHCHMCRLECPASVDIPKLMVEAKGAAVANNGQSPSDWFLSRIDLLSAWGCRFSRITNLALGNRSARWVFEKLLGIAQGRKLPRVANRNFINTASHKRLTKPSRQAGDKVLYFVDTYANYHDTQLAESLVQILQHNGVQVFVPPGQKQAGMPLISAGAIDPARRIALHNVHLLAEAVRQGYWIVTTEPSAALCLTHEYPSLIDDPDARLVADHASEACTYLFKRHQAGNLKLDFNPLKLRVAYHMPCHMRALSEMSPSEHLLRLIPGVHVEHLERGCSGMAGVYGLKRKNYRSSLRAGWPLISGLRRADVQVGTTECSTCKIQMEQGANRPTIHPIKLLALAYGLAPEIEKCLYSPTQELFVT
jgi:FAD/FMN-containing dehydrogenase/Fe-S oxidoreductase